MNSSFAKQDANGMVLEMASILGVTEIDESTLQLCIKLLDQGVDPKVLASQILKIKSETDMIMN